MHLDTYNIHLHVCTMIGNDCFAFLNSETKFDKNDLNVKSKNVCNWFITVPFVVIKSLIVIESLFGSNGSYKKWP